jgi:hypothetical protein
MLLLAERSACSPIPSPHRDDGDLFVRIEAEFREMPGLRLTLPQAARLFNIERNRCDAILRALVRAGRLAAEGKTFVSARDARPHA